MNQESSNPHRSIHPCYDGDQVLRRDPYLERIGLEQTDVASRDIQTLERLQLAHIMRVPFETLAITGDPFGTWDGEPISLAIPDIYEKIVTDRRGGYCFELNGLFGWLLDDLGFDVRYVAARIKSDGELGPPADHLTLLVELNDPYLVDVGLGIPKLRQPLPLEGTPVVDNANMRWRIVPSNRADADYTVQYRPSDDNEWDTRCIFEDIPRDMGFFQATSEYFERAPDSSFTGDPVVIIATDRGHSKLSPSAVTRSVNSDVTTEPISQADWYRLLNEEYGIVFPSTKSPDDSSETLSHGDPTDDIH